MRSIDEVALVGPAGTLCHQLPFILGWIRRGRWSSGRHSLLGFHRPDRCLQHVLHRSCDVCDVCLFGNFRWRRRHHRHSL